MKAILKQTPKKIQAMHAAMMMKRPEEVLTSNAITSYFVRPSALTLNP